MSNLDKIKEANAKRNSPAKPEGSVLDKIKEANAKRLSGSRKKFGQTHVFLIGPDYDEGGECKNPLYDGHSRYDVWLKDYGPGFVVACRQSNRALDDDELKEYIIIDHSGTRGEWDIDKIANNFDIPDLEDWGFDIPISDFVPPDIFPEYDESIADEVEYNECPECGHRWPK